MGVYNLFQKPSVEKDFRKIPSAIARTIFKKIEQLAVQPIPPQAIKLTGADRFYRIRVGDYRIIYEVDHSELRITVHYVRHRRDVYRSL
jgi:mRNA interferase RelE/StbE